MTRCHSFILLAIWFPSFALAAAADFITFDSKAYFDVCTEADGIIGRTPTPDRKGVQIPNDAFWYVRPIYKNMTPDEIKTVVDECRRLKIPAIKFYEYKDAEDRSRLDDILKSFVNLPYLQSIDVGGQPYQEPMLSSRGLKIVSKMPGVKRLRLCASGYTEEEYGIITQMKNLEELVIEMDDENNFHIAYDDMKSLRRIMIYGYEPVMNESSAKALANNDTLKAFSCFSANPNNQIMESICALMATKGNIEELDIDDKLDNEILKQFKKVKKLRCTNLCKTGIASLFVIKDLESLTITGCSLSRTDISSLSVLTKLQHLSLEVELTGNGQLDDLAGIANLRTISIPITRSKDLAFLNKLNQLESVSIRKMSADFLIELENASVKKKIKQLELVGPMDDRSANILGSLENLEVLDIQQTEPSPSGLKRLEPLRKVRVLNLPPSITDEGLEGIKNWSELRKIYVHAPGISDKGLKNLSRITGLVYIDLSGCSITDNVFDTLLKYKRAVEIRLGDTHVTDEMIGRIQQQLPATLFIR